MSITNRSPTVSAIMICLNGEDFIEEAIASVQNQTVSDWELIVVDDGSTDATAGKVEAAMRTDPRIHLVTHSENQNMGMSASRNRGVAVAQGQYVAFLDCDDIWLPDKLANQLEPLITDSDLGMVYGRTEIWSSWRTGRRDDDFFYDLGVETDRCYTPPKLFNLLMLNRYQSPTSCGSLIRREVIEAVGGFDPEFRGMFEDQVFYARLLSQNRVYVDDRCCARYRQHEKAHTSHVKDRITLRRAHLRYLRATARYLHNRKIRDRSMHQALWRARNRTRIRLAAAYVRAILERMV